MSVIDDVDWLVVQGSGGHIRSEPDRLIVSQDSTVTEYSLAALTHLLLLGRHTIQTGTVNRLVKQGVRITFLEPDGEAVGVVRPFADREDERRRRLQETAPAHAAAITIVAHTAHARLGLIGERNATLYEGELELLQDLIQEIPNLIRIQELRRVHRMIGDMYYEIMARTLPGDLGFRRRTERGSRDPVNALLSLADGLLAATVLTSCIGARLDPSLGIISAGTRSLVQDIADCFRTDMVDRTVFSLARGELEQNRYDRAADRCRLADTVVRDVTARLRATIDRDRIDRQVHRYVRSIEGDLPFLIV